MNHRFPTRRNLLKSGGAIAAISTLPRWFVEETLDAAEPKPPTSPNDKPNFALVGCGGRGRAIAKDAEPFGNIVAVCDVDDRHAEGASVDFRGAKPYHDFRKLMERDDIPIILNATPDHWHTLVNLHAIKAGKDIYSEKPLTLTIDEGKRVTAAIKGSDRILQTGTQQRSDPNFRLACEMVRNGRVGKLQEVSVVLPAGFRGGPFTSEPVPAGLDWDMWQGQSPATDYVKERCGFSFRYWYDYSGGTMTDWGAHHNDIARWGIGLDGPATIEGKPLVLPIPGGYTAFSEYQVEYVWPNGVRQQCRSTTDDEWTGSLKRSGPGTLHHGVKLVGADGWIFVTRGHVEASKPELIHEPLGSGAVRLYASNNHMANFFECVRTRKQPAVPAEVGHRSASLCHLGTLALRLGRKLNWDPVKEEFIGDDDAQKWVAREMRKPWDYSVV